MSKSRTYPIVKLSEMELGQTADCFVQLVEKKRSTTREGKPFVTCRYRDARRTVGAIPIWGDAPLYEESQKWQIGLFFKVRARLSEHERYGLQLEIDQIRPIEDRDREEGFAELDFVEHPRLDAERMFADLCVSSRRRLPMRLALTRSETPQRPRPHYQTAARLGSALLFFRRRMA